MAKKKTPAQLTWTPENLWALANASAAVNHGTPPPGVPQPAPFDPNSDPGYVATAGASNQQLADVLTGLGVTFGPDGKPVFSGGQYLQAAQSYGIDENGNPITEGDTRYDPFNQLNELKKNFENRKRGTTNSYAAAGQLYSGALNRAKETDATNYARSYSGLQRGATSTYADIVAKALGAKDTTAVNIAGASGTALGNQLAQHANDPPPVLTPNLGGGPKVAAPQTATPKAVVRKPRRILTLGGRIANRSGFVKPKLKGPLGY